MYFRGTILSILEEILICFSGQKSIQHLKNRLLQEGFLNSPELFPQQGFNYLRDLNLRAKTSRFV
jgi:hypothetical protein